ncbi:MAG: M23 family metallopeptidase [Clostridiales bacterium]|nr:M23 family metallopeptidase [Clostridiales bacterium]
MKKDPTEQDTFEFDELNETLPPKREKKPLGAAALVSLALALIMLAAGTAAAFAKGLQPLPRRVVEAMNAPVQQEQPGETAPEAPSEGGSAPEETQSTDISAHYDRTAILIDGEILGVLASREAAENLIREALAYFEMQILGSGTLTTEAENEISYEPAPVTTDYDTTFDALFTYLTGEDTPLRVRAALVDEVITYEDYESVTEEDKTLLEGTRIIVRYGVVGETHTVTTRSFLNGKEQGKPETVTLVAREAVDALVRIGTEKVDYDAEPGKKEGDRGRKPESIIFLHPTEKKRIGSNFGQREGVLHLGLDYTGDVGAAVLASAPGTVVSVIERGGYGLMIEIAHEEGFLTRYAHLSEASVSIGDSVEAGAVIGAMGQSGNAEEPHLHFELRIDGVAYNPRYYLN